MPAGSPWLSPVVSQILEEFHSPGGFVDRYLAGGVELLARADADFGFIAANTPHLVFDEIQRRSAIPLIDNLKILSA